MSETEIINEEPNIPEPRMSEEDKFFGQTTEIQTEVDEGLSVEIVDDTPEEDRRPPKVETPEFGASFLDVGRGQKQGLEIIFGNQAFDSILRCFEACFHHFQVPVHHQTHSYYYY